MIQEVNMKQKLLMICLTLVSLSMLGIASPVAQPNGQDREYYEPDYDDEGLYTSDNGYSYDDAYSSVDWDNLRDDNLYYSYYDDENVFMVVVGNRIYIVPYDFFYYRIWPRHRSYFRYCHYDHFSNWWGVSFYNQLWYGYHYRHYNYYGHYNRYNRHHNFYRDHYRRPRVVIHRDGWRAPSSRDRVDRNYRGQQQNRVYRDNRTLYRKGDKSRSSYTPDSRTPQRVIRPRSDETYRSRSDRSSTTERRSYRSSGRTSSGSGSGSSSSARRSSSSSSSSGRSSSSSGRSSSSGSSSSSSSGSSSKGSAVKKK